MIGKILFSEAQKLMQKGYFFSFWAYARFGHVGTFLKSSQRAPSLLHWKNSIAITCLFLTLSYAGSDDTNIKNSRQGNFPTISSMTPTKLYSTRARAHFQILMKLGWRQPGHKRTWKLAGKHTKVELHRDTVSWLCQFSGCFLASCFGLVGRTSAAIQPREVVHSSSNFQKSIHQTDIFN